MTTHTISSVALEGFGIEPSVEGDRLVLRLSGTGDMAAVRHLEQCLKDTHAEVARLGLRAVDINVKALYLLNSSCLKCLVSFVYTIQSEGPRYEVRFVTDPHLGWQPRSLRVIERLAPDIVSISES